MREKDFENMVKAFLKEKGCWFLKTWSNGIQREGVPDILACCNGYFLGIELKAQNGKPSELQLWNIEKIRKAGGIGIVLYPDQFEQFQLLIHQLRYDNNKELHSAWKDYQTEFDRKTRKEERGMNHGKLV